MVKMAMDRQRGFTYIFILIAVAILGLMLAGAGGIWHVTQQREKERELLFIGDQFRQAIALYYERTTSAVKQYPKSLDDLLADKRFADSPPYLRKIFYDPMTHQKKWGIINSPDGRIMGIHSLSDDQPLKVWGFSAADEKFSGKQKYSEWKFVYIPNVP
jgi:type II secretory pathway pseudopilin PulG